jgi:hypothetical protein
VEADFFFRRVGIQFTAHRLQPVEDVKRFSLAGAFKGHMFPEVRNALLVGFFVAAANVQRKAAVRNFGVGNLLVHQLDAVGQGIYLIVFHVNSPFLPVQPVIAGGHSRICKNTQKTVRKVDAPSGATPSFNPSPFNIPGSAFVI